MAFCLAEAGLRAGRRSTRSPTRTTRSSRRRPTATSRPPSGRACARCTSRRAPLFLRTALPGLDPATVRWVAHHVAHAASATFASGFDPCDVLVLDGRGERGSHLAGALRRRRLEVLAAQALPHSLGLLYEELTAHLGFRRSSDEYKVMAMASYGEPSLLDELRELVRADGARRVRRRRRRPRRARAAARARRGVHAARTPTSRPRVQRRLEEVLLDLAAWLHARTGDRDLVMAGGVALNCVANSRLWREGPFERDLGAARGGRRRARRSAPPCTWRPSSATTSRRCGTAALGRGWDDDALERRLRTAGRRRTSGRTTSPTAVAEALARNEVVAWFQGRSEFGPRALGHRSLLADPRRAANLERLNDIKGREQFRPVAPMVLAERGRGDLRRRPLPRPYMLFTHGVRDRLGRADPGRRARRRHRADPDRRPRSRSRWWRGCSSASRRRTGVPVVVNTSLNTAGRPMVDDPRDALECFGSAPGRPARDRARSRVRAGGRRRDGAGVSVRRRHPHRRAAVPARAARRRSRRATGRCRSAWCSSTTARDRSRAARLAAPPRAAVGARDVLAGDARGPAAARNRGWRAARAEWVAFLDDDVVPAARLARRRSRPTSRRRRRRRRLAGPDPACRCRATGGRPTGSATSPASSTRAGRPPTWPTGATALAAVGGFDERFPRAYREDADLGLRLTGAGLADRARPPHRPAPGRRRPAARSRCASRPATPTTC